MFLHAFFKGFSKNIVFRSGALVKFFFTDRTFFRPVPYPKNLKKYIFNKKSFKLLFIKIHKVKNKSVRTKKPTACLGLILSSTYFARRAVDVIVTLPLREALYSNLRLSKL